LAERNLASSVRVHHGACRAAETDRVAKSRHSLQAGVHVKIVSERLGHSSVTITLDTYSHTIPGLQRDAAERVAALIPGLGGQPPRRG
jgi:integrase